MYRYLNTKISLQLRRTWCNVCYVMQVSIPFKSYYDIIIVLNLPSAFQSGYYSRASPNSDTVIFQTNTFSPETWTASSTTLVRRLERANKPRREKEIGKRKRPILACLIKLLKPNINIQILICCPNKFPIEVVWRSCWSIKQIHLVRSFPKLLSPSCFFYITRTSLKMITLRPNFAQSKFRPNFKMSFSKILRNK